MPRSVVIVDDSKYIVDILAKFFKEKMQFNVLGKSTVGLEAIGLYRDIKPDLLTMDFNMPFFNGLEVIEEIVREFPEAKILVVSAVRGEAIIDCLQAGAANFISKPLAFQDSTFVEHFMEIVNQIVP
jgi:two-component system chemotaxis response regulator CheY